MQHGFGPTIFQALPRHSPGLTIRELSAKLGAERQPAPGMTAIRRHLNHLTQMDVVQRDTGSRGLSRYWRLTDCLLDSFEIAVDMEELHA